MGFGRRKLVTGILFVSVAGFIFSILELHSNTDIHDTLVYRKHKFPSEQQYRNDVIDKIAPESNLVQQPNGEHVLHHRNKNQKQRTTTTQKPQIVHVDEPVKQHVKHKKKHHQKAADEHRKICKGDCEKFQKLFKSWPNGKPRAAFYTITQKKRFKQLLEMLDSVEGNFVHAYPYPFIIFHEADLNEDIDNIRRRSKVNLYFQEITFTIPEFLEKPVEYNIPCLSAVGYRHMCRFHIKTVFDEPIIEPLEYYWRLDDDSLLTKPVDYDVFQMMHDQQLSYGYIWKHFDSSECTTGLWNATRQFIKEHHVTPTFFETWREPRLFYNNFEISRTDIWKSAGYVQYADYLDHLGGIYYHRWGDAPIKGLGLSLFVSMEKIHYFEDIGYKHGTFVNPPKKKIYKKKRKH